MHSLFLNDLIFIDFTTADCLFYIFNLFFTVAVASGGIALYFYLRPKLPARVNCWFCNRSFLVPYTSRHCFDCRFCDQYNGFTSDGDYNVDILERNKDKTNYCFGKKKERDNKSDNGNGLCKSCNTNQQLKVQQLASFLPLNDASYEQEIEKFKEQLDKYYRLCDACSLVLTQTLQAQQYDLLTQRLNGHCRAEPLSTSLPSSLKRRTADLFNTVSLACLLCLITGTAIDLAADFQATREFSLTLMSLLQVLPTIDLFLVACLGAFLNLCSRIAYLSMAPQDLLLSSAWLILLCLTYCNLPLVNLLASIVCFTISVIPSRKQVIKKTVINATPVPEPKPVESKLEKTIADEVPKPTTLEKPKQVNKPREKVPESPRKIETRSQSAKKVAAEKHVSNKTNQERGRLFSPPPEVYNAFNSLRLSSVEPTERPHKKPANFLFENIKYDSAQKNNLIKPSKLNMNFNSHKNEPIEEPKQFSTTENVLHDLNISTFSPISNYPPKSDALSPISNFPPKCPMSPAVPYSYDCEFSPYGPSGYLPSMPMGHTTVYTFARPAPYPFNYSPPRCVPPFPPCESPFSPRISEVSSSASFSSPVESQKWCWLKRGLYIFSVLLNMLTMLFLAFSFWKN